MTEPVRRVLACAIVLLFAAPLALANPAREVAAEAEHMARALLAASEPAEAEELILRVLERAGLGVYDAIGNPVVVGNEGSEDGLWLLDAEVEAMAIAFVEGQLTPLDALAADWRDAGVLVDEGRGPTPVTGGIVERALRQVRAEVERDDEHPQAFVILLIDALGDREDFPFDLLDEEEAELGFAAPGEDAAAAMMRAAFEEALRDAIADEDPEAAAMFDAALADDATFDAMMAAMMRGDMATVIELLMGAEAVGEMEEARQFLQEDLADPDQPPEVRDFLRAADTLLDALTTPGDESALAMMEASLSALAATRDLQRAALEQEAADWTEELEAIMADDVSASTRYTGFTNLAAVFPLLEWRAHEFLKLEEFVEDMTASVEEEREDREEGQRKAETMTLPWEEENGSDLLLDPLQVLLVAIDLLVEPRPPRTAANTSPAALGAWPDDAILASSTEGNCLGIGHLQSAFPDAFGALESALSTGRSIRGALTEAASGGGMATLKRLAGAAVDWATVRIDVEVEYLPNDAGGATGGIHRPHHRDDDRRVVLHVRARDTLPDLMPPRMRELMQQFGPNVQVCGFLKDMASDMGAGTLSDALNAIERLTEGRDLANLPVIVDLGGEAWSVLHVRVRDWDGQRGASGMTMIARTDEDGYASGPLLPRLVSPDVGGMRTVVSVPVRVQLVLTESADIAIRRSALAARVTEEILRPVQRWVQVHVAHFEPLPIRGSLHLDRSVQETGRVLTLVDDVVTTVERTARYELELAVENAALVGGAGPAGAPGPAVAAPWPVGAAAGDGAALTVSVTYELMETVTEEWAGVCDGVPTPFSRTTVTEANVRASGSGRAPPPTLEVSSLTSYYAIQPAVPMMAVSLALYSGTVSGTETIETTHRGCGEPTTERDDRPGSLDEEALGVALGPARLPGAHRQPFRRAAQRLTADISWEEVVPDDRFVAWLLQTGGNVPPIRFSASNHLRWDFTRGD